MANKFLLLLLQIYLDGLDELILLNSVEFCWQAEDFNDAVQVVRDWLPQAEAELKFRTISEDEEGIIRLIENHEVLTPYFITTRTQQARLLGFGSPETQTFEPHNYF